MMSQWLFRQARVSSVLALTVLLLAGCSVFADRVQTWQGAKPAGVDVAVLKLPGNIAIQSVNGIEQRSFIMNDLALEYELLPGRNEIVLVHKTIWGRKDVVEDGESKVNTVLSEPQRVVFDAEPGEVYTFETPALDSLAAARAFASDPSIPLVNSSGRVVADVVPADSASPEVASEPQGNTGGSAPALSSESSPSDEPTDKANVGAAKMDRLDAMKTIWKDASAEERQSFLRWALD